jgi:hypothetical protein
VLYNYTISLCRSFVFYAFLSINKMSAYHIQEMEIGIKHILLFITIVVFIAVFYSIISKRLYNVGQEGFSLGGMGKGTPDLGGMGKGTPDLGGMGKGTPDLGGMGKGTPDLGGMGTDLGKTDAPKPVQVEKDAPKPVQVKMDAPKPVQVKTESAPDISCSNAYADSNTLPLREYVIKACYNSAYDPNNSPKLSALNLETRIAEGYRFIDLNVFSSEGKM